MRADVDRAGQAAGHRTETSVKAVNPLDVRAALVGDTEPIVDPDPLDHEDVILGLDLADGFDLILLRIDFDLARLQRAGESAGQSAARGGHDVVERRRVRRILPGLDPVVLGDL